MNLVTQLIQESNNGKPVAIYNTFDQIMEEKVKSILEKKHLEVASSFLDEKELDNDDENKDPDSEKQNITQVDTNDDNADKTNDDENKDKK